jgi:membrane protease YdiL (CAAX protease family)
MRFDQRGIVEPFDIELAFVLLIVPVDLLAWVYYGKRAAFERFFARGSGDQNVNAVLYEYVAAFLLMFAVPFVGMTIVLNHSPREFGLQLGDIRLGGLVLAIGLPVALLAAWLGSADPAMQAEYPLDKRIGQSPCRFLLVETFYLVYYVGWEFLFRGVMLFSLYQRFGALLAVWVQTLPSAIVHIGKPAAESFAAIPAGILFGYVALETQSIVYPLILHAAIGIATDVFVITRQARRRRQKAGCSSRGRRAGYS